MPTVTTSFTTDDGLTLDARWAVPAHAAPRASVVLCHPHPQRGGSMHNPPLLAVADRLLAAGLAVLRFDFRGVGRSDGEWAGGSGERGDVIAALAATADLANCPIVVGGWSFGAAVSLAAVAARVAQGTAPVPWFGLAPAFGITPDLDPHATGHAAKLIVRGDRDQIVDAASTTAIGAALPGDVSEVVLAGCDHFFVGAHAAHAGDAVASFVCDGLDAPP